VIDGRTGAERFAREFEESVGGVAASPDGKVLAVAISDLGRGAQNRVVLLDATSGDRLAALPVQRKGAAVLAFSPEGRFLAVGFGGAVQVWDVKTRELVRTFRGFERVVSSLAFSPDGKLLASGTQDGQVWVWATDTGRPLQLIEVGGRGVRSLGFSRDGTRLVTLANAVPVSLWNVTPANAPPAGDLE
jgi:WD40 repeat protein